jgi:hypothetical protein
MNHYMARDQQLVYNHTLELYEKLSQAFSTPTIM